MAGRGDGAAVSVEEFQELRTQIDMIPLGFVPDLSMRGVG